MRGWGGGDEERKRGEVKRGRGGDVEWWIG